MATQTAKPQVPQQLTPPYASDEGTGMPTKTSRTAEPSERVMTLRLTDEMHAALKTIADVDGVPVIGVVRLAINDYLAGKSKMWKAAYEEEARKFQAETLRTSALYAPLGQDGPVLPRSVVMERRYQRRAGRLKAQRDHWKTEYEKLHDFLSLFPFYEQTRVKLSEARRERERIKDLEQRCREQSLLIETCREQSLLIETLRFKK